MIFKNICILVLWAKVASALEGFYKASLQNEGPPSQGWSHVISVNQNPFLLVSISIIWHSTIISECSSIKKLILIRHNYNHNCSGIITITVGFHNLTCQIPCTQHGGQILGKSVELHSPLMNSSGSSPGPNLPSSSWSVQIVSLSMLGTKT